MEVELHSGADYGDPLRQMRGLLDEPLTQLHETPFSMLRNKDTVSAAPQ